MPFTVSHAAAVLLFRRLKLVWSAFIIGSMAPDFPYIIGNTEYRFVGHRLPGVVVFTIPASLAALWLYHNVIKRPMIGLLPGGVQARLRAQVREDFQFGGDGRFLAIMVSTVLGIATHVTWDAFTHAYTWPWRHFAWLRIHVPVPFVGLKPLYGVLQYASTVVGILALAIWVWLWYARSAPQQQPLHKPASKSRFGLALAMCTVAAVIGIVRAALLVGSPLAPARADFFLLIFGVTTLAMAFWQLLVYCVLVSSYQVWILN